MKIFVIFIVLLSVACGGKKQTQEISIDCVIDRKRWDSVFKVCMDAEEKTSKTAYACNYIANEQAMIPSILPLGQYPSGCKEKKIGADNNESEMVTPN